MGSAVAKDKVVSVKVTPEDLMGVNLGPPPEEALVERYQIGDEVEYLPHMCHAYNCNANNEYPWVIGLKQNPHYEVDPNTGDREVVEDVVELEEGHMHRSVLPGVHRSPNPREEHKKLVPLRPRKPWRAVVTNVNSDGTVDLDIDSNVGSGMVTLSYRRVPVDESGSRPHTCRKEQPCLA